MKPSVGRIVHYVSRGSADSVFPKACRAAMVTELCLFPPHAEEGDVCVGLAVLNPTGMFFHEHVVQVEGELAPGTWHWPERVEE